MRSRICVGRRGRCPKSAVGERGEPERASTPADARGSGAKRAGGSTAPSRTAAIGGTRVARQRRPQAREQRDDDPDQERDDDRARLRRRRPAVRQVEPDRVEERVQPLRERRARGRGPMTEASTPITSRLEQDRAEHLPARGAERPQRRELPRPLGDRDRERVRDHEGADEERDAAEGEQELLQERGSSFVSLASVFACSVAGPHLRLGRQDRAGSARASSRRRDAAAWPRRGSGRAGPACWKSFCAVGRSKTAIVAPPIVETPPKLTRPEIRNGCAGPAPRRRSVADLEVLLAAVARVDANSPARGQRAVDERERVEALVATGRRRSRGSARRRRDRLAVRADQLRLGPSTAADAAATSGSARTFASSDSANGGAVVLPAVAEVERRLAADDRVGVAGTSR